MSIQHCSPVKVPKGLQDQMRKDLLEIPGLEVGGAIGVGKMASINVSGGDVAMAAAKAARDSFMEEGHARELGEVCNFFETKLITKLEKIPGLEISSEPAGADNLKLNVRGIRGAVDQAEVLCNEIRSATETSVEVSESQGSRIKTLAEEFSKVPNVSCEKKRNTGHNRYWKFELTGSYTSLAAAGKRYRELFTEEEYTLEKHVRKDALPMEPRSLQTARGKFPGCTIELVDSEDTWDVKATGPNIDVKLAISTFQNWYDYELEIANFFTLPPGVPEWALFLANSPDKLELQGVQAEFMQYAKRPVGGGPGIEADTAKRLGESFKACLGAHMCEEKNKPDFQPHADTAITYREITATLRKMNAQDPGAVRDLWRCIGGGGAAEPARAEDTSARMVPTIIDNDGELRACAMSPDAGQPRIADLLEAPLSPIAENPTSPLLREMPSSVDFGSPSAAGGNTGMADSIDVDGSGVNVSFESFIATEPVTAPLAARLHGPGHPEAARAHPIGQGIRVPFQPEIQGSSATTASRLVFNSQAAQNAVNQFSTATTAFTRYFHFPAQQPQHGQPIPMLRYVNRQARSVTHFYGSWANQ